MSLEGRSWRDDLTPLFQPSSIAIVGASERNHYSQLAVENVARFGFPEERLFIVNPNRETVFGRRTYRSLQDIPHDVELAMLLVNRDLTLEVFQDCLRKGVRAVVILASGFAEMDAKGAEIQAELARLAKEHQVLVCGPNCTGVADLANRTVAYDGGGELPERAGVVSVVFQSGGLMNPLMETAGFRGVGLRRLASVGNSAVLGPEDFIRYLVEDPGTRVIMSYIESFRDPERAIAALELAAERRKPILMIKAGKSQRARRAVQSHTASMVSSGLAWESVLRQKGVVLVDNIDELVETAGLLSHTADRHVTPTVGFITISGGDTTLICDIAQKNCLEVPDLCPEVRGEILGMIEKPTLLGNPLDLESRFRIGDEPFFRCMDYFLSEPHFSIVAARPNLPKVPTEKMLAVCAEMKRRVEGRGKTLVLFSRATERWDLAWFSALSDMGIPFLQEFDKGCAALRRLVDYCQFQERRAEGLAECHVKPAGGDFQPLIERSGVQLHEEAAAIMESYAIPLARGGVATSANEAAELAQRIGFPAVLKVNSRDVAHRNRVGGVALGLRNVAEVLEAYGRVMARTLEAKPGARLNGVVVQEQIEGLLEAIVGLTVDPQLGPLVAVGIGGVFVEALGDIAVARPPLSRVEARELLRSLRGARLLDAREGYDPDVDSLVDIICKVSWMGVDAKGIDLELDLNPVIVRQRGQGAVAVDVFLARGEAMRYALS